MVAWATPSLASSGDGRGDGRHLKAPGTGEASSGATIPVGLVGLVAERPFRVTFGKPTTAGIFLIVNGVILF